MKPHKRETASGVTAQPRSLRQERPADGGEEGLSIDPEQMGQSFLRYATEQGDSTDDELPELRIDGAPESDEAQPDSHFNVDASVWDNTADLLSEHEGRLGDVTNEAVPPLLPEDDRSMPGPAERPHVVEIDLTKSVIEEASLLDEESSVLGESVPKESRTDDTGVRRGAQDDEAD